MGEQHCRFKKMGSPMSNHGLKTIWVTCCFPVLFLVRPLPSLTAQTPHAVLKNHYRILREWCRDTVRVKKQIESFSKTPLDDIFDWEEITHRMFAANWVNLSDYWQKRFVGDIRRKLLAEFSDYIIRPPFAFTDQSVRWGDEELSDNKAAVSLHLLHASEIEEIGLRLTLSGSDWKIYDIRSEHFRLFQDLLAGFDDMVSNGFSNEYIEAVALGAPAFTIDDFSDHEVQDFPRSWGWRKKDDDVMHGERIYSVQKEGNNLFLSARAQNSSVTLVKPFSYNIKDYPFLSWKWRVKQFPAADPSGDEPDRVAAVTVIFYQNWIGIPITLRYIWIPKATPCSIVIKEKLFNNTYSIVLRSESDSSRQWIEENVNPFADYQRIFGEPPPEQIVGIYVLTDSHSAYSVSAADYDDFTARRKSDKISCYH
jgi:ABC-type transporter MlaC component